MAPTSIPPHIDSPDDILTARWSIGWILVTAVPAAFFSAMFALFSLNAFAFSNLESRLFCGTVSVASGLCFGLCISRMLDRRVQLRVNKSGIFCSILSPNFVPADLIKGCSVTPVGASSILRLAVSTQIQSIHGVNAWNAWLYPKRREGVLMVAGLAMGMLSCSASDIKRAVDQILPTDAGSRSSAA
jgi:hypothetical protein